jgi:hypothetical protein
MRKFIRDVVLRSAEIIKARDFAAHDHGKPSKCMFCDRHPGFTVSNGSKQVFVCSDHLGPFIADWTTNKALTVVRI